MRRPQRYKLIMPTQYIIPASLQAIAFVKPFAVELFEHLFFVEMPVDYPDIVPDSRIPLRPFRIVLKSRNITGQSILEEALRLNMIYDKEIIVEIDKMLR